MTAIKYVVEEDAVVHLMNGYIVLLKDLSLLLNGERDLLVFTWVFTGYSLSPSKITNVASVSCSAFAPRLNHKTGRGGLSPDRQVAGFQQGVVKVSVTDIRVEHEVRL